MSSANEPFPGVTARCLPLRGGVAAVVLLAALAGCSGGSSGVVYNSSFTIGYDPFSVGAEMSSAPLLVETYGSPAAGLAAETVRQATVQSLRQYGATWFPRNYTANPLDAGNRPYRLRIAYNVPRAFDRQLVCSTTMGSDVLEAARRQGEDTSRRTLASFCRGETTLGTAEGAPGAAAEVGSESFSRFVGHLGREVMPRRNPERDDCLFRNCD
ncbi:MAG: hypothetical protein ACFCUT_20815 [Kiloniellaceae bacterium]